MHQDPGAEDPVDLDARQPQPAAGRQDPGRHVADADRAERDFGHHRALDPGAPPAGEHAFAGVGHRQPEFFDERALQDDVGAARIEQELRSRPPIVSRTTGSGSATTKSSATGPAAASIR